MKYAEFMRVSRVTIVGADGLAFEEYGLFSHGCEVHLQDAGRTMKVFPLNKEFPLERGGLPVEEEEYTNLDRAIEIRRRIYDLIQVREELKRAFADDKLDGGWKAAFEHPLWAQTQEEVDRLREELKGLI